MATDASAPNLALLSQKNNPATSSIKVNTDGKSAADTAAVGLNGDFQSFMKMLTIQLKNQDPTSPMDTNQFTQQIVAFTGVEQQVATNKNLEKLINNSNNNQLGSAVGYIGRLVEAEGDTSTLVNGDAAFSYELPKAGLNSTIVISNSKGQMVYYGEGEKTVGKKTFHWDGKNSFTGNVEDPGDYKITVYAKDTSNADMTVKTYATGAVRGVTMQNGEAVLQVGANSVPMSKVISIKMPANVI